MTCDAEDARRAARPNAAFQSFISREAFDALVQLTLLVIEKGEAVLAATGAEVTAALRSALSPITDADDAEAYARKVQARPAALIFAAPEAKGAILYRLSERFVFSFEERQEAAILTVVGTVQTQHEWQLIAERITPNGRKSSYAAGMARLRTVMDGGSARKFEALVRAIGSLPPATLLAGTPVLVRNIA